jgi:hypothetical protein
LKVLADLEKAEKKRQMLSEENGRKINIKPLPVSNKGLRGAGDPSYARLSRMDMN